MILTIPITTTRQQQHFWKISQRIYNQKRFLLVVVVAESRIPSYSSSFLSYQQQQQQNPKLLLLACRRKQARTKVTTTTTTTSTPSSSEPSSQPSTLHDLTDKVKVSTTTNAAAPDVTVPPPPTTAPVPPTTTTTTTVEDDDTKTTTASKSVPPVSLFPWRSEITPIPRLVPGTMEYINDNLVLSPRGQSIISTIFLDMPFYQLLYPNFYQQRLADTVGWCFPYGVAAILSNVYTNNTATNQQQHHLVDSVTGQLDFTYPYPNTNTTTAENSTTAAPESSSKNDSSSSPNEKVTTKSKTTDDSDTSSSSSSGRMFHPKLQELFSSAYQSMKQHHVANDDGIKIQLQTIPTRAILYNILCLPYFTREMIEHDPARYLNSVQSIIELSKTNPYGSFQLLNEHVENIIYQKLENNEIQDENDPISLETTVEIQVLLECTELFRVIHGSTGALLQGHDTIRTNVVHLVRLEATVTTHQQTTFPWTLTNTRTNWQITDIDDLLGSRTWYHGPVPPSTK